MVEIKYLGHSCFLINSSAGKFIIDPFITGNPKAPVSVEDIDVDLILVTHGHKDHLGDAIEISERTGAPVVAIFELAMWMQAQGAKVIPMNFGGTIEFNGAKITMVPAVHSGDVVEDKIYPTGNPGGFVIEVDDRRIYHTGDTMVFGDMKLISELFGPIDVMLLPIGGVYTMDVVQAKYALKLVKPRYAIPMHYDTWDVIRANPEELKVQGVETVVLKPGESFEI